jgi:predicted flap endonuclease-1-like 5' DNA nuclease
MIGAIVAAALARMGKENGMSTIARLAAWNTREIQRLEHRAKRRGGGR